MLELRRHTYVRRRKMMIKITMEKFSGEVEPLTDHNMPKGIKFSKEKETTFFLADKKKNLNYRGVNF